VQARRRRNRQLSACSGGHFISTTGRTGPPERWIEAKSTRLRSRLPALVSPDDRANALRDTQHSPLRAVAPRGPRIHSEAVNLGLAVKEPNCRVTWLPLAAARTRPRAVSEPLRTRLLGDPSRVAAAHRRRRSAPGGHAQWRHTTWPLLGAVRGIRQVQARRCAVERHARAP
jgi:hypothetical protein